MGSKHVEGAYLSERWGTSTEIFGEVCIESVREWDSTALQQKKRENNKKANKLYRGRDVYMANVGEVRRRETKRNECNLLRMQKWNEEEEEEEEERMAKIITDNKWLEKIDAQSSL